MTADDAKVAGPQMPAAGRRGFSWWSVLWLTLVWLLLWGAVDPVLLVGGFLVSVLVLVAFPLPRVPIKLRVRPWQVIVLVSRFLYDLVVASAEVAWLAVRPGPVARGVVLELELAGDDELLQTITAEMVALVPGTVVIDLDSMQRILTLHALNVGTPKQAQGVRHRVLGQEARVLRAFHPDPDSLLDPRRRRATQEQRDAARARRDEDALEARRAADHDPEGRP
ncbi:Na+/H+ antiporter subunit E [Ornithinimicrobium panacihumi]|uniref:Na+/H+ antiporter subunit E n=1 Tax=Ornithinimicrobium panacihumi TaxID=2008449 RepID=UPI003F8BA62C